VALGLLLLTLVLLLNAAIQLAGDSREGLEIRPASATQGFALEIDAFHLDERSSPWWDETVPEDSFSAVLAFWSAPSPGAFSGTGAGAWIPPTPARGTRRPPAASLDLPRDRGGEPRLPDRGVSLPAEEVRGRVGTMAERLVLELS
jgi:hypothetical protein